MRTYLLHGAAALIRESLRTIYRIGKFCTQLSLILIPFDYLCLPNLAISAQELPRNFLNEERGSLCHCGLISDYMRRHLYKGCLSTYSFFNLALLTFALQTFYRFFASAS